ncbi:MAG: class I SAM-dependent methyltransferase [Blastomonas sp.]|nr:class I SAM-dependent methyltransferase [Blastomonas sp.]MDM7955913.1 class I SAM-dependent methyltransferase [Blastomonas sp.]
MPRLITFCCSQPAVAKARGRIVPRAHGDVLELGCGGGINLDHYDRARVTALSGVDPSPQLLDTARAKARARGFEADFRPGMAESLPFADASFDTVLTTFTLCSVQDPKAVLSEMRRVLRPGGTILFLEHGAAPDSGPARWQQRIEPMWKKIAGGCHLTRPVSDSFRARGFHLSNCHSQYMPKTPRFLGWLEMGEARA